MNFIHLEDLIGLRLIKINKLFIFLSISKLIKTIIISFKNVENLVETLLCIVYGL